MRLCYAPLGAIRIDDDEDDVNDDDDDDDNDDDGDDDRKYSQSGKKKAVLYSVALHVTFPSCTALIVLATVFSKVSKGTSVYTE